MKLRDLITFATERRAAPDAELWVEDRAGARLPVSIGVTDVGDVVITVHLRHRDHRPNEWGGEFC